MSEERRDRDRHVDTRVAIDKELVKGSPWGSVGVGSISGTLMYAQAYKAVGTAL